MEKQATLGARKKAPAWAYLVLAVDAVLATPVAVWWLTGDQSAPMPPGTRMDYMIKPLDIDPAVERIIGIAAVLVTILTVGFLVHATRTGRLDRRWWGTLAALLGAGAIAGFSWRTFTAGTIGANIGAGIIFYPVIIIIAVLLVWAIGWSVRILRSGGSQAD